MKRHRRRKGKKLRMAFLMLFIITFVAYVVFAVRSERRRFETLAAIQPPPELVYHEKLAEAIAHRDDGTVEASSPELQPALDTVTTWAALFQRKRDEIDGEEWDAIQKRWHETGNKGALEPADRERIIAFLESHRDFLDALRTQAARGGPVQAVTQARIDAYEMDHLTILGECATLLILDMYASAESEILVRTVDDAVAGMQLYEALAPEPAYESLSMRYTLSEIVHDAIGEALPVGQLSPEATARLIYQAQAAAGRDAMLPALRQHHIEVNRVMNAALSQGWTGRYEDVAWERELMTGRTPRWGEKALLFAYASPVARPWFNRDAARVSAFKSRMETCTLLPHYESGPAIHTAVDDLYSGSRMCPWMQHAIMTSVNARAGQAYHEVRLQLLQVGLSLEQWRAEKGALPASLDALSATLPEATLVDPFTGDRLFYRPKEDTFLLYSADGNRVDDGGKHAYGSGDIVWRGTW